LGLVFYAVLQSLNAVCQTASVSIEGLPENPGANISRIAAFGDYVWIVADDTQHGEEPWVYSARSGSIRLLKDVYPGSPGSRISESLVVGDRLFFAATSGDVGHELWVTDGTSEGTKLVRDLRPGRTKGSNPRTFSKLGDRLLFVANDEVHGDELWISDGTSEGTRLLGDIHLRDDDSGTTFQPVVMGDVALFRTVPITEEGELWRTDGTEEGTYKIEMGGTYLDAYLSRIAGFDDFALFSAISPGLGVELWRTDGTAEGTHLLRDINPGTSDSIPSQFAQIGDRLFFQAQDGQRGKEIWVSDGTFEGTRILRDIIPGPGGSDPYPLRAAGNQLFFTATTEETGHELWVSDGTRDGTRLVMDFLPGPKSGKPYAITPAGNGVYFSVGHAEVGEELWYSDGTTEGTRMVKDIYPGPASSEPYFLQVLDGVVYFEANDGLHGGELWCSDGSESGTRLVADLNRPNSPYYSSDPQHLTPVGESLFFTASASDGTSWWHRTDGTREGTSRLDDLGRFRKDGDVTSLRMGDDGTLIAFDRESTGAVVYHAIDEKDSNSSPESSSSPLFETNDNGPFLAAFGGDTDHEISEMVLVYDSIFFIRNDRLGRLEKKDGGLSELKSPVSIHGLRSLTAFGGGIVFSASSAENGEELWYAVGNEIRLVDDLFPGTESSSPSDFAVLNDVLFFVAADAAGGREIWKMNTADMEPVRFTSLSSETRTSLGLPSQLVVCDESVFFTATDATHGRELWVTDGTEDGTRLVSDIFKGPPSSFPEELTVVGGKIFFRAETFEKGVELFAYDSIDKRTYLVADKATGEVSFQPRELTEFDGRLFCVARGTAGDGRPIENNLWYVEAGMLKVLTVSSNDPDAAARDLTVVGDQLFFSSFNMFYGRELWVVKRDPGSSGYSAHCVVDLLSQPDEIAVSTPGSD
jgi:ELWxxDGT repeat protein